MSFTKPTKVIGAAILAAPMMFVSPNIDEAGYFEFSSKAIAKSCRSMRSDFRRHRRAAKRKRTGVSFFYYEGRYKKASGRNGIRCGIGGKKNPALAKSGARQACERGLPANQKGKCKLTMKYIP